MAHENLHLQVDVEIDGTRLTNVRSLMLDQHIDSHHTFEVRTPLDAIEGERAINFNTSTNFIGKEIKIALKSQSGDAQLNYFKGIVTNVNLSRHGGAASDLIIKGHSSSILLDDGPNCSSHLDKTIKQIVQTTTAQYPVNLINIKNSPSPDTMLPFHIQYNESTYNFLSRLANTHGQWFFYNGTDMIFGSPESGAPLELFFGHDLSTFDLSMKVMPLKFEALSYDYVKKEGLKKPSTQSVAGQSSIGEKAIAQSKSLFSKQSTIHNRELVKDNSELNTIVSNRLASRAGDLVAIKGVSDNPKLKVGSRIKVQGSSNASLGSDKTDYGIFILTSVTHNTDGLGSYHNNFKAIPADLKIPPFNANMRQPQIDTQMAGVVDNKDPDGMGRIKVKMYWQKDGETTGWIRYATSHAGKDRGFYMIPEVDDEVIVTFENGNPSMPFALASMYNGKNHSSDRKEDENNTKAIRTKSGNEIFFNDKGGEEAIHIYTKDKANELLITMKDDGLIQITSNKNIKITAVADLEINAENIKITASKNYELTVGENMTTQVGSKSETTVGSDVKETFGANLETTVGSNCELTVGQELKMTSGTKAKLSSTEIAIEANAKATVKANAQLELTSSAITTLKGTLVQIN